MARPVRVADPRVLVGLVRSGRGRTAVFVNCSPDTVAVEPLFADDLSLESYSPTLTLAPYAVVAAAIQDSVPADELVGAGAEGRDARA